MNEQLQRKNKNKKVNEHFAMLDAAQRVITEFFQLSTPLRAEPAGNVPEYRLGGVNQVFTEVNDLGKENFYRFDPNAIVGAVPISPLWKNRIDEIAKEIRNLSGMSVRVDTNGVFTLHATENTPTVTCNIIAANIIVAQPQESKGDEKNNQGIASQRQMATGQRQTTIGQPQALQPATGHPQASQPEKAVTNTNVRPDNVDATEPALL